MKAVVYEKNTRTLINREVQTPVPADNEVLVKIIAASANALDYRSMRMGIIPKNKIFGADIAGRVEAIGKDAHTFALGDAVFADLSDIGLGGFAEYVAVPESRLVRIPQGVSFEQAAALPVAATTALQALRNKGGLKRGQRVLICGAGGGVGTYAVQLAKHFGTHVSAVCGTHNVALVKSLGADHVIDYTTDDFTKGDAKYDLILAINGGYPLSAYKRALYPSGKCIIVGGKMSQLIKTMTLGSVMSVGKKKISVLPAKSSTDDLAYLIGLVEKGQINPVIESRYPLSETAQALRELAKGHARGKTIITVSGEEI